MNQILLVFSFVLFCIAALFNPTAPAGTPWYGRFHFGWAGLAFWVLTLILR